MLNAALAHVTATPHIHGDAADAILAVALVLVVALAPRLVRRLRGLFAAA